MPRKVKDETSTALNTVTVSVELKQETYAQIRQAADSCGYTVDEWLMEAVMDKL